MKKISLLLLFFTLFSSSLLAHNFTKVASSKPLLVQVGSAKQWCPVCGMSLKMFYKTSHTSKLHDNTPRQYCSMRCLVVDMQEKSISMDDIKVVDAKSEELIDAKMAFYVVGSKIHGTMAKVSKIAFLNESDAKAFVKKYKGKIVDFKTAISLAKESLSSDIAMITKKKEKKMYPMGKKIFLKKCKRDIELNKYKAINELKAALKNDKLCKPLKGKHLQALTLYLWEVKKSGDATTKEDTINISKSDKCPICGMFVYKYPKWATQIFYAKGKHYSFDGVKDMMKYYFKNSEGISKILVLDYYSQKTIDARDAYYVIGSDIYGPMGNELIAFKSKSSAKTFYIDHRGAKIVQFKDITQDEVYRLDE